MTEAMINLPEAISKSDDTDFLRELIQDAAQRLMEIEVGAVCGAGLRERTPDRGNQRNGYRPRRWDTRAGTIGLNIPKLRKGSYFPTFLEPRRTAEKALMAVVQEAYIHGVSTRAVDDLVRAMGLTGTSKSQVSRLCEEIDERVQAFLNRPLEGDWPFLWLDATYVKLREGGRVVSMAVIVAVAVNSDGRREILGITVMPSEAETFWADFLRSLTRRGLRGVQMVISDAHEGLRGRPQYACDSYRKLLRLHRITASMSRKGNCLDNAPMESFFSSLKTEIIHRTKFQTRREAKAALLESHRDLLQPPAAPLQHRIPNSGTGEDGHDAQNGGLIQQAPRPDRGARSLRGTSRRTGDAGDEPGARRDARRGPRQSRDAGPHGGAAGARRRAGPCRAADRGAEGAVGPGR